MSAPVRPEYTPEGWEKEGFIDTSLQLAANGIAKAIKAADRLRSLPQRMADSARELFGADDINS